MRPLLALISVALLTAGCAVKPPAANTHTPETPAIAVTPPPQPPVEPSTPPSSQAPSEPVVYLSPSVPRHPGALKHNESSDQRFSMEVKDQDIAAVLMWYTSELESRGWTTEPTVLPSERVLRFAKEGRYLSVAAYSASYIGSTATILHVHDRSAPEVSQTAAVSIASNTHPSVGPDQWVVTHDPAFETDRYGVTVKHPVWVLTATFPRSMVKVWVDALTAEPIRVMQASDY